MKEVVIALALSIMLISGCSTGKTNKERMANDLCQCFEGTKNVLSDETMNLYESISFSTDAAVLQSALAKLDSVTLQKVLRESVRVGEIMEEETGGDECVRSLDEKHQIFSNASLSKELIGLLKSKRECRAALFYLNLSLKSAK